MFGLLLEGRPLPVLVELLLLSPDRLERLRVDDEFLVRLLLTFGVVGVNWVWPSDPPLISRNFLLKKDDLIRGTFGVIWKWVSFVMIEQFKAFKTI